MAKPTHVLSATDFSEASDEALRQASGVARRNGARFSVLHIVPNWMSASPLIPAGSVVQTHLEMTMETRALDDLASRVRDVTGRAGNDVELAIRLGAADSALVHYAEQNAVDLVVVGATGQTGLSRLLLGTTAERVIRHAHCSVLVARDAKKPPSNKVLVATDLSESALAAVSRAREEANDLGSALELVHVMDISSVAWSAAAPFGGVPVALPQSQIAEMHNLAKSALLGLGGPNSKAHVIEGSPKRAIVALADSMNADLLVVGTHGRTGFVRMALGSVAEAVASLAHGSVLVVR